MLYSNSWHPSYVALAGVLMLIVRPVSVFLGLAGSGENWWTQSMIAWFGVRGIGSLYYLMYAIQHGLPEELTTTLVSVVLVVVAMSVFVHGISAAPLMRLHTKRR
jgi:NhaP-type Na+/H+ or K+/H+ antiporter